MNWIDISVLIVVALSTFLGVIRGAVGSVIGVIAIGLAFLGIYHFGDSFAQILTESFGKSGFIVPSAYVLIFLLIFITVGIAGRLLKKLIHFADLGSIDYFGGLILGLARGVFFTLIFAFLINLSFIRNVIADTETWQNSIFLPHMNTALEKLIPYLSEFQESYIPLDDSADDSTDDPSDVPSDVPAESEEKGKKKEREKKKKEEEQNNSSSEKSEKSELIAETVASINRDNDEYYQVAEELIRYSNVGADNAATQEALRQFKESTEEEEKRNYYQRIVSKLNSFNGYLDCLIDAQRQNCDPLLFAQEKKTAPAPSQIKLNVDSINSNLEENFFTQFSDWLNCSLFDCEQDNVASIVPDVPFQADDAPAPAASPSAVAAPSASDKDSTCHDCGGVISISKKKLRSGVTKFTCKTLESGLISCDSGN